MLPILSPTKNLNGIYNVWTGSVDTVVDCQGELQGSVNEARKGTSVQGQGEMARLGGRVEEGDRR